MSNKKSTLPLKILSVVLACFVWYYVMSIGDPVNTKIISGIKVTTVNDGYLRNLGKIYTVKNDSNIISVRVTDRRSITDRLSAEDFSAVADLSKWNESGNIPISVTSKNPKVSNSNFTQSSYSMQIEIDNFVEKTFPVRVNAVGKPATNMAVGSLYATPESVTISGAEREINQIDSLQAFVTVTGIRHSFDTVAEIAPIDKDGNEVSGETLKYVSLASDAKKKVKVTVKLLRTNKIPFKVNLTGKLPEGYLLGDIVCEPSSIAVKGTNNNVSGIKSIAINDGRFNLSNVKESFTVTIPVENLLPDDVELYNPDDAKSNVTVTVNINKMNSVNITIPSEGIKLNKAPENMNCKIIGDATVTATVFGSPDDLNNLDYDALHPSVDLSQCTEARIYKLPLQLDLPNSMISSSLNHVFIEVTKKSDKSEPADNEEKDNKDNNKDNKDQKDDQNKGDDHSGKKDHGDLSDSKNHDNEGEGDQPAANTGKDLT